MLVAVMSYVTEREKEFEYLFFDFPFLSRIALLRKIFRLHVAYHPFIKKSSYTYTINKPKEVY